VSGSTARLWKGAADMPRSATKMAQRRLQILEFLERESMASIQTLAEQHQVTTVTIRTDLEVLEQEGRLRRIPGGAVSVAHRTQEQPAGISLLEEKQSIARAILERIRDGDTLFLNSGTTTLVLARMLKQHRNNLNIVTNSVAAALELGSASTFRVILLGGEINARFGFTYGAQAEEQLSRYRADFAVLALDGIDCQGGLTIYHPEEAAVISIILAGSKQLVVAADHTKIGRPGFTHFGAIGPAGLLVTTEPVPDSVMQQLRDKGVNIIISK